MDTLVHEHDNILRMLDVLRAASLRAMRGRPVNTDDLLRIEIFIRQYADKGHHGKEEDLLFPVMADELGELGKSLFRHGMLVEHDMGRLYVSDLHDAVTAYRTEPTDAAKLSILVAAGSYERLLRRHIEKENDVVFPFGGRNLSAEALAWLDEQTRVFEENDKNAVKRKRQLDVLEEMERKYRPEAVVQPVLPINGAALQNTLVSAE